MGIHLPVLIVGAGPTGLMMACELARHGVFFRIIDKSVKPTFSSKAVWIQTRTIEIFEHIGIADQFLKSGNICKGINLYINGKSLGKMSFDYIDSVYKFVLMLPQSETENLLNQRLETLNIKVEREVELIDIMQKKDNVSASLKHADGHLESIISDWVIACDGANSTIREKCKFSFPGKDLPEQFIVADAEIQSYMPKTEAHIFFDNHELFAVFPLGLNRYRIIANLHLDYQRKAISEREVIALVQERAQGNYYIKKVSWVSSFWIHSRIVKRMQNKNIFLAGDAAHIHSPAGGQGMNTGIQDAYNLAWKLAKVINDQAKPSILNSYHLERYPIIKKIVEQTEHYTKMALFDRGFTKKARNFAAKIKHNKKILSRKIGSQLTQLNIQYKNSPAISYRKVSGKSLAPGLRAPDVILDGGSHLYNYFRNTKYNVLLFSGLKFSKKKSEKLIQLQAFLQQNYAELVDVYIVSKEKIAKASNIILDEKGLIHLHYQISNSAVYVVRPDTYISFCSKTLDFKNLTSFFKKIMPARR